LDKEEKRISEVDQFIQEQIDTVPHREALLLVWRHRPKTWSVAGMAASLYVPPDTSRQILRDLASRNLLVQDADSAVFFYKSSPDQDRLTAFVDETYRRELLRISRLIHAKAPSSLRAFAKSFRFTKEGE